MNNIKTLFRILCIRILKFMICFFKYEIFKKRLIYVSWHIFHYISIPIITYSTYKLNSFSILYRGLLINKNKSTIMAKMMRKMSAKKAGKKMLNKKKWVIYSFQLWYNLFEFLHMRLLSAWYFYQEVVSLIVCLYAEVYGFLHTI